LRRLHFALAPSGVIFLGHAEMLLSHSDKFSPIDMNSRVFRKTAGSHTNLDRFDPSTPLQRRGDLAGLNPIRDLAFRASPVPQIVVTGDDTVAMVNEQAERVFGLSARDIGRLLRDLEVSYRPLELRSYLDQARVERKSALIQDVQWQRSGGEPNWYEVHVNPLVDTDDELIGTSIAFFDVTATRNLLTQVGQANSQLESAYEELQSTNEELETTNEELQSTVEELETTNEELQSTNEELETMNEELQSTNDELHTINETLRDRSRELEETKGFLDALVDSVKLGIIVVDREMRIVLWNRGSEDLWGLRSVEVVGAPLASLDIGLPLTDINPLIGRILVDPGTVENTAVDAVNRRGKQVRIRVT